MSNGARRLAVAGVFAAILLSAGANARPSPSQAQASCDPNYAPVAAGCVPGDRDYDCPELQDMGLGDIPVIGTDWQRLDGYQDYNTGQWIYPPDGLGCEWYGE